MERETRQRRAVLHALAGSGRTLSPPEILALAQEHAPRLNLSTVYRQVKALAEAGEVVKVQLPGQATRFEARCGPAAGPAGGSEVTARGPAAGPVSETLEPHHHHHFHCTVCDQVVPIHGCPGAMQELAPAGYEVQGHELVLHGRCAVCAQAASR